MRRLKILFYWLLKAKNNVVWGELIRFLSKPTVQNIARKYIREISQDPDYQISFNTIPYALYWPQQYPLQHSFTVIAETFDQSDWHYYQKTPTQITKGDILLDIGAAEGLFALSVIDQCSKVYLIEPNPHFCQTLTKTFANFKDKIHLIQSAVGNEEGEINFDANEILAGKIDTSSANFIQVSIQKIDSLISDNQRIDFIKADIEGYELEMLKGAEKTIKRNKPKMSITTYHQANDAKQIIDLIKSYVPEYQYFIKGVTQYSGKPVMVHFYL